MVDLEDQEREQTAWSGIASLLSEVLSDVWSRCEFILSGKDESERGPFKIFQQDPRVACSPLGPGRSLGGYQQL